MITLPSILSTQDESVRGHVDSRSLLARTCDRDLASSCLQLAPISSLEVCPPNLNARKTTHADSKATSISNLTAPIPPDPPGLRLRLDFKSDRPLNPLAVYVNAIHLMHELAKYPWDDVLHKSWVTCEEGYGLVISLHTSLFLQTRYIVSALYKSVLAMAEERPGFFRLSSRLNFFDEGIGSMEFKKVGEPLHEMFTFGSNNNTTNITSTVLRDPVIDPEDEKFIINWDDTDASIPVQSILFAAFDALATVAQYPQDSSCGGIHGISATANAVLFLGPYHDQSIPCGRITRALLLIVMHIVIGKKIFRVMDFDLRFDGTQIGQGYLMKMPPLVGGTNGTGASASS